MKEEVSKLSGKSKSRNHPNGQRRKLKTNEDRAPRSAKKGIASEKTLADCRDKELEKAKIKR